MMINIDTIILLICLLISIKTQQKIGFGWNSFITSKNTGIPWITERGVPNWSNHEVIISIYFYVNNPGKLNLKLESASN